MIPNELDYLKKIDLIKKNILQKKIKKVVLSRIEQYNISNIEGISTIINNINKDNKIIGIGETGLDFYYEHSDRKTQKKCQT